MEKRDCKIEWTEIKRHIAIPLSGDQLTDDTVKEYTKRMDGKDIADYKLNHLRWETLENLCREIVLQYGEDLDTYDFEAPYIISDITIRAVNSEGEDAFISLWLNVKDDVCIWSRDAIFRGISVQTLIRWHLDTNLLTSVSVIRECEFFDSRSRSARTNRYTHIEDNLSDMIIDVFKTLRVPEYTEARDITKCVWGINKDEGLRFDLSRPRKSEREFEEFRSNIDSYFI